MATTLRGGVKLDNTTISNIENSGTITGGITSLWINNSNVGDIENSGTLSGILGITATNTLIGGINNTGLIDALGGIGINTHSGIGTITNSGIIKGHQSIQSEYHSAIVVIDNSGIIEGGINAINNSTIGMIQNSGTIGSISAIHFSTTNSINNTGTIKDEITGIRVEENSHVGNIDNSGTIEGGLAAILAPEADSNSIYSINLLGTDARLIGDVYAPSATVAIKYGAVFSTENAYAVQGFIIENGAMLNMGIGNSTTGDPRLRHHSI